MEIHIYITMLSAWGLLFFLEGKIPLRVSPQRSERLLANITSGGIWFLLARPFTLLVLFFFLNTFAMKLHLDRKIDFFGAVWGILLLDYITYHWHRLNHKLPLLRRFHMVHHSDLEVDVTTALRFHLVELIGFQLLLVLSLLVFRIKLEVFMIHGLVLFVCGLFHHSNLQINSSLDKILSKFLVTPSFHLVHHSVEPKEFNSNYASIFSFWDKIHKTYVPLNNITEFGIRNDKGLGNASFMKMLSGPFKNDP